MTTELLEVRDLVVDYMTGRGTVRALDGVELMVRKGESIGIVGESGSGKSSLAVALPRLLPAHARRVRGEVILNGESVYELGNRALRELRATRIGFVFQNPRASLDPTRRIASQLLDTPRSELIAWLSRVGLRDPDRVAFSYPHELS